MKMKMSIKFFLLTGLMLFCLSFIVPAFSIAGGGDSWKRHIHNNSDQSVTVHTSTINGNVWFDGCVNSENGPCTIAPHSSMQIKYTTTAASCWGSFLWGNNNCNGEYRGGGQPGSHHAPHFTGSKSCRLGTLTIEFDNPDNGDITIY